mgnify:CR=1 FL=1
MARISDAAKLKLAIGREKVRAAIDADGGTTVYAAHLLPHTAPWLPGVLASGVKLLEITHGSIYLSQNPPRRDVAFGGRFRCSRSAAAPTKTRSASTS